MDTKRLPVFEKFIQDIRASWAQLPDTETRMKKTAELLRGLVGDETMRQHCKNWPSSDGHKNLLLYEDPDYGFVINAVVRVQGAQGGGRNVGEACHMYDVFRFLTGSRVRSISASAIDPGPVPFQRNENFSATTSPRLASAASAEMGSPDASGGGGNAMR